MSPARKQSGLALYRRLLLEARWRSAGFRPGGLERTDETRPVGDRRSVA